MVVRSGMNFHFGNDFEWIAAGLRGGLESGVLKGGCSSCEAADQTGKLRSSCWSNAVTWGMLVLEAGKEVRSSSWLGFYAEIRVGHLHCRNLSTLHTTISSSVVAARKAIERRVHTW